MASTKDVLDHHLKCFADGDLKGILHDYAPGAVLFTPDGPLRHTAGGRGRRRCPQRSGAWNLPSWGRPGSPDSPFEPTADDAASRQRRAAGAESMRSLLDPSPRR